MKKVSLLLLTLCAGAFAQSDTVVHWRGIQGVITAPGIDNPVGQIHSGAGPWTTQAGNAELSFKLTVPVVCNNPLFLIRVPAGKWIATATKPATSPTSGY